MGPLSVDRKALAVANALVAVDLHLAADVLCDITTEVTLDGQVRSEFTSSSVRSRTRVSGLIPVSASACFDVVSPTPKM